MEYKKKVLNSHMPLKAQIPLDLLHLQNHRGGLLIVGSNQ